MSDDVSCWREQIAEIDRKIRYLHASPYKARQLEKRRRLEEKIMKAKGPYVPPVKEVSCGGFVNIDIERPEGMWKGNEHR